MCFKNSLKKNEVWEWKNCTRFQINFIMPNLNSGERYECSSGNFKLSKMLYTALHVFCSWWHLAHKKKCSYIASIDTDTITEHLHTAVSEAMSTSSRLKNSIAEFCFYIYVCTLEANWIENVYWPIELLAIWEDSQHNLI